MDRPSKRPRLSMACNVCRQRKVKCDAEYPKCRNCRVRNQACVTTDPQRPGCPGLREWLDAPEKQLQITAVDAGIQNNEYLQKVDGDAGADSEVSPVRQPFDTSVNTEDGTKRMKILGGSSSQCLAKSLDVYFKAARMQPVSEFFRHGMRHAEELDLVLALLLPELPDREKRARYMSVYRSRIYPLYPVFDLNHECAQCPTEEGERYLHGAASLLAHIIVVPYLHTVQALIHFTIAYRGHNQEGLAWQTLGMAIRIAYTLGLHHAQPSKVPIDASEKPGIRVRVWATCCALEKLMHLASGWPTLISDDLMARGDSLKGTEYRFLHWHLGLAEYQGSISDHLYSHRAGRNTRSVRTILADTARLDRALLSWANDIPVELRPGNDITCASDEFHMAAFLSIEYHATMIALHRAALIAPRAKMEQEVMKHCSDDPSRFRLASGESICVNSARAIAKLSIELQDRGLDSCLIPAGTAHTTSRLQAMDMQLLKACLAYSSTRMAQSNIDPRFIEGLAMIYEQIQIRLDTYLEGAEQAYCRGPHAFAQLPTPSTNEPTSPARTRNLGQENSRYHPAQATMPRRAQSFSHPVPSLDRNGLGIHNEWAQTQQEPLNTQLPLDSSDISFLSGPAAGMGEFPTEIDQVFPFEGFNVEELWNWMMYYDSPPSTEVL
ncbi:hypothetical protein BJX65DRAFT_295361 [Aspergillus insuetus]